VAFDDYDIQPETATDTGLNSNVYECGALAVKTFGWYRTGDPVSPNYAVTDTSQQFTFGTDGRAETTNAVNAMAIFASITNDTNRPYFATYGTGFRAEGNQGSGRLWILGTYYWIHDLGRSKSWTLSYYYDNSSNAFGERVKLISYD
jgi:hypothetical protein